MTRMAKWGWLGLALALAVPVAVTAQGSGPGPGPGCPDCPGRHGAGPGRAGRMFDPSTVTTIQGEIADVQRIERGRRHAGVHLVVAMGSDQVAVHLGPDFYVDVQALKLAKGDRIEVKGSRVTFGGKPAIIAQEVRRDGQVLALRDENGVPLWRGMGRR